MFTSHVTFLIEYHDGHVAYKSLRADNVTIARLKTIGKARFRAEPNVVHVAAGNGYYTNSYGAH